MKTNSVEEVEKFMDEHPHNANIATIALCSFVAGMQLAIRICRNRAEDCKRMGKDDQEALVCEGLIRICQVEIGTGKMPLPRFSEEEQEELNRIA
jgi:hypothetical protein